MYDVKEIEILHKIEVLRQNMYDAYQNQSDSEEVVKISQQLDHVMNQLTKIM
ncbi:aspartyl-phosphate phosphatase Spo0E family protein [Aquibacillus sediminis]|uniref:aspartyl-phosphate phosphatase Spo0E family protein n=1 Tax=Aquibacillus sediminis TaxID=2574734 RepID=UPI0011087277|nr:aspartyl-phosphate phosphatase Spo0E family protein [Aquibacillus sediminis]